jgi:Protein of unknown function (DUF3631)
MPSADLVKDLVAIEGRPWAEMGKNRDRPMTQNRLASMLRPLKITSENLRVGDKIAKGYILEHFKEAFARYLPPEGGFEPLHRYKADETGTSEPFQTATPKPDVADRKCEKPNTDGRCSVVADEKGAPSENTHVRPTNGGVEPGLSRRTITELAEGYTERAYGNAQENGGDTRTAELDADLRRRLAEMVLPEFIEVEFERVMTEVFRV